MVATRRSRRKQAPRERAPRHLVIGSVGRIRRAAPRGTPDAFRLRMVARRAAATRARVRQSTMAQHRAGGGLKSVLLFQLESNYLVPEVRESWISRDFDSLMNAAARYVATTANPPVRRYACAF